MNKLNDTSDEIENNEYSLSELYYLLRKHNKKILLSLIVCFLLSLFYSFTVNPKYRSSSVVMLNQDGGSMSMLDITLGNDRNYIENEIEVLKSLTLSKLVVEKLTNSKYRDNLYLLGTNKTKTSLIGKILYSFDFYENNNNNLELLINDEIIYKASNQLRNSIQISNKRNTDIITVSITSKSSEEASILVNTLIEMYKSQDVSWATGEMTHIKEFLTEQIAQKEIELGVVEQKLKIFQEEQQIFSLEDNSRLLLEDMMKFESELNNTLIAIDILNEKEKYINNILTKNEKELSKRVSNNINQRLAALKNEMSILEVEKISTINKYGNMHSAVNEIGKKLSNLKQSIQTETELLIKKGISVADPILFRQSLMDSAINFQSVRSNLESKSIAYKKIVDEYESKLTNLPEKLIEFSRLERMRSIFIETFGFMSQRLEEARIGEASNLGKIRVIDKALSIKKPIKPDKFLNVLFGSLLGIIIGVGISAIIEILDGSIKSINQVERTGLTILSLIPAIKTSNENKKTKKYIYKNKNKNIQQLQRRLITHEDPKSPISESYRSLRTSLMYTKTDNTKNNIILVSSPGPGEGKTTTIANLAITYANLGKKTLLVDSDLRKPVLHNVFKLDKSPGLTSCLIGNISYKKIIQKSEVENLDIITSGVIPPNPSELLDSPNMKIFLANINKEYDIILFDSPPLIAVTDASVIFKHVDQFCLVIRAGVTQRGALNRVISLTSQAGMNITGVIMNAISQEHSYGYGYYSNYYDYYYGDEK